MNEQPNHPALQRLSSLILDASQRMNLTSDRDPGLFWQRHILDALAAAERIEAVTGTPDSSLPVLDVGAGSGIPGLVWAIFWPEASVDLIEPRRKRVEFLRAAAAELGLSAVRILEGRAEDLGQDPALREHYGLVTARALAPLPTLAELTLPFVRPGGWLGAIKTAPLDAELAQARRALETLGAVPEVNLQPYERGDGKPCLVCLVRKTRPTPGAYPRRPNLPERRPL